VEPRIRELRADVSSAPGAVGRRMFLRRAIAVLGASALVPLLSAACTSSQPAAPTAAPAKPAGAAKPSTAPASPAAAASPAAKPLATMASAPKAAEPVANVKVGVVGAASFSPFEAGVALGLFEKDNLQVEVVEHRGGAEAAQAMVGGGIDIFNGDFSHALRLNQQGQQIRVICGTTNRHAYVLMGAPDAQPGVQSLKGQNVGITSPGSQTDNSMRWLLKTNGLDPDKDTELVAIGGGAPMLAAIQNKQVYAGTLVQPFTAQLRLQNYVPVYSFTDEVGPFQGTVMMVRESLLQEKPDVIRRFLRSYLGVVKTLQEDEAARNQAVTKLYPQIDPTVAQAAVADLIKAYPPDGKVTEEAVQKVFEFDKVARGVDQPAPPLSSFADFSYLPS
jgi:NitT/TauT family transport system substrate-binding protein